MDKAYKERKVDQQDRDIDIGKVHIALGVEHRGKLDKPGAHAVAEHDLVSEVYHIIDGISDAGTGAAPGEQAAPPRRRGNRAAL